MSPAATLPSIPRPSTEVAAPRPSLVHLFLAFTFCTPGVAMAQVVFDAQAGASLPLSAAQRTFLENGWELRVSPALALGEFLELPLEFGVGGWPTSSRAWQAPGALFTAETGARLRVPVAGARIVPWAQVSGGYAWTGGLHQVAASAAVGVQWCASPAQRFCIGPLARYQHVFALSAQALATNSDAGLLSLAISVHMKLPYAGALEAPSEASSAPRSTAPAPAPSVELRPQQSPRSDQDDDGVPDALDGCPSEPGLRADRGCPNAVRFSVHRSQVTLDETITFELGTDVVASDSVAALKEVLATLEEDGHICANIVGTPGAAPSRGNVRLATERALTVRRYFTARAVETRRLGTRVADVPRAVDVDPPGGPAAFSALREEGFVSLRLAACEALGNVDAIPAGRE
jgi:outer membrane protein OmpA-like peptidoglycan-associated protein